MFAGYRSIVVALGLILSSPAHSQEHKTDQSPPAKNGEGQLARIAAAIEKIPVASTPDRGCKPGQDDRQSDLCAQWKAADAAAESARWTLWTFFASMAGLGIGGGTLVAAIFAAKFAKDAAAHTESGAKAAHEALSHDKTIAEREMRPWLSVEAHPTGKLVKVGSTEFKAEIKITVENIGKEVARGVQVYVKCANILGNNDPMFSFFDERLDDYSPEWGALLMPGDTEKRIEVVTMSGDDMAGAIEIEGRKAITPVAYISVVYSSLSDPQPKQTGMSYIFGSIRESGNMQVLWLDSGDIPEGTTGMAYHPSGCRAT